MKWLLGLLVVLVAIFGALFGVGYFLLSNDLTVTRSVEVERPRASVFAMIEDLRIAKEWSPYYALDPDAEYTFSGPERGEGQSMRWSSSVRQVGDGRMTIVRTVENAEVEAILELSDRASLNSEITLTPGASETRVDWTVNATCAAGAINVPCRYMNLVAAQMIQKDVDNGLARLKTLTEQLPNVDFEGLRPTFEIVEPQNYIYSVVSTSTQDGAQLEMALADGVNQVDGFFERYNLQKSGPQVRVTTDWNAAEQTMTFRVGFPFAGPRPLTLVGVQVGQTPSGSALRVLHDGPRTGMRNTYEQIYAYLQAHRIATREDGLPWELVDEQPAEVEGGAARTTTEIYVPLE